MKICVATNYAPESITMSSSIVKVLGTESSALVCIWQDRETIRVRVVEDTPIPATGSLIRVWHDRTKASGCPAYATYRGDDVAEVIRTIAESLRPLRI